MSELTPNQLEHVVEFSEELRVKTQELCGAFGLTGLTTEITPGAGWKVTQGDYGITLSIDPLQLVESAYLSEGIQIDRDKIIDNIVTTDKEYVKHTIAHELGHVRDFLGDTDGNMAKRVHSASSQFFWNMIDDATIDTRLRRVPAFDAITNDLYETVLFPGDDYTDLPKSAQLMYALTKGSVTGNPPRVSPEVEKVCKELGAIEAQGKTHDIMKVLAHSSSTLADRMQLAEAYIQPHFGSLAGQDSAEDTDVEEYYADQMQHNHSGHGCTGSGTSDGEGGSSFAQSIAQALANYYGNGAGYLEQGNFSGDDTENVSRELAADPIYAELLNKHAHDIGDAARVFLTLGVPSSTLVSLRYTNRAVYNGNRLHSKHLVQAVIQMASCIEQPVWRSIEQRGKKVDFKLEKLDIHLLVDESGSMGGWPAEQAGVLSVILMEGLELAKHWILKNMPQHQKPDVRVQVMTFGSNFTTVIPLSSQPPLVERQKALKVIRAAEGGSTIVTGALKKIREQAAANPSRQQLILVVSDGGIHDHQEAQKVVRSLDNKYSASNKSRVIEFIVGSSWGSIGITPYVSNVTSAGQLQTEMQKQFTDFVTGLRP